MQRQHALTFVQVHEGAAGGGRGGIERHGVEVERDQAAGGDRPQGAGLPGDRRAQIAARQGS